jgi:acetyl esterase/lipase
LRKCSVQTYLMKRNLYILFLILLTVGSCTKDNKEEIPTLPLAKLALENVSYGPHERQKLDILLPANRNMQTPIVIMLHGGSWIEGDKSDFYMTEIQEQLHQQRIGSIRVNYRYAALDNHFEGLMDDIKRAIDHLTAHAEEYGMRDQKFTLMGFSAGAHMALLYGYKYQRPNEISNVVSIAGPTDIRTLSTDFAMNLAISQVLVGVPLLELLTSPRYAQASPISHVATAVPTLLVHGTADEVVPYAQSTTLKTALDNQKIPAKLITLQGANHDVSLQDAHLLKLYIEAISWIKTQGK